MFLAVDLHIGGKSDQGEACDARVLLSMHYPNVILWYERMNLYNRTKDQSWNVCIVCTVLGLAHLRNVLQLRI
jgi:hypothetical protein